MNPSPLAEGRLLKAWIAFFLLATVGGAVAGAIAGGALGFILGALGVETDTIVWASKVLGYVIALPISYGAFRWAVLQFCRPPAPPPALPGDA